MSEKQSHIIFSGIVQGVGFRWTAERIANSLRLTGWVRNCPDGTVEVICEGKEANIHVFIDKIKKDMAHYIRSTRIEWSDPTGEYKSFDIRFY